MLGSALPAHTYLVKQAAKLKDDIAAAERQNTDLRRLLERRAMPSRDKPLVRSFPQ